MPGGDRTGPMGMGPMTGRRAGLCAGAGAPGFVSAVTNFGGFGRGRGLRNRYWPSGGSVPAPAPMTAAISAAVPLILAVATALLRRKA